MRARRHKGVTLVEALLASSVSGLALAMMVAVLVRLASQASAVDAAADGSARLVQALLEIRSALADARAVEMTGEDTVLKFTTSAGSGELRSNQGQLLYRRPGTARECAVVDRGVARLAVSLRDGSLVRIEVSLSLAGARPGAPRRSVDQIQEVLVPGLVRAESWAPWRGALD